jgi:hypothetical protein
VPGEGEGEGELGCYRGLADASFAGEDLSLLALSIQKYKDGTYQHYILYPIQRHDCFILLL